MKNKKASFLILGLMLMFVFGISVASAAEFRIGRDGGGVTTGSEEVIKNLYTIGNILLINGDVQKDLHAGGNVVTVNGNVENSVLAGGSTVNINGDVGGSVHAAGSSIIIDGNISEDLFLAGGNIVISKSASVGGDLFVAAGTVDIQGFVAGEVHVAGGMVTINGKIDGPVVIKAKELIIGESAEIMQGLKYTSLEEAKINDGAKIFGTIDFTQKEVRGADKTHALKILFGIFTVFFLIKLVAMIVAGLVLVYLFKKITGPVVINSFKKFWSSIGIGFAVLILAPILAILLAVSVIGLWVAGLILVLYLLMIILASVLAGVAFGSWLIKTFGKNKEYDVGWKQVVYGAIAMAIVCLIPFAGWLVCLGFFLISLGSICQLAHQSHFKK